MIAKEGAERIRVGARLVREWNGRTHIITVEEDGFSYTGQSNFSLSAIGQAFFWMSQGCGSNQLRH